MECNEWQPLDVAWQPGDPLFKPGPFQLQPMVDVYRDDVCKAARWSPEIGWHND